MTMGMGKWIIEPNGQAAKAACPCLPNENQPTYWRGVSQNALGTILAAFVIVFACYMFACIQTGTLLPISYFSDTLRDRPVLVWYGRQFDREQLEYASWFSTTPDGVRGRYQILVVNRGHAPSRAAAVRIDFAPLDVASLAATGGVSVQHRSGSWISIEGSDRPFTSPDSELNFRISELRPGETIQIDVGFIHPFKNVVSFPLTEITYEGGEATLGASRLDPAKWTKLKR
jgi:hypothetical protein